MPRPFMIPHMSYPMPLAHTARQLSEAKGAGGEALVDCTGVDDAAEVLQSCMNAGSASGLSAESPRILNHQA